MAPPCVRKIIQLIVFALMLHSSIIVPVSGQFTNNYTNLSCPQGFLVAFQISVVGNDVFPGYTCAVDPCYINWCGPGNTCNTVTVGTEQSRSYQGTCTCQPPYATGSILSPQGAYSSCFLPDGDVCNPNPCQNGAACSYTTYHGIPQGKADFTCSCPPNFTGKTCAIQYTTYPTVTGTVNGVSGPLAKAVYSTSALCSPQTSYPVACLYNDGSHYTCCDSYGCGPISSDGNTAFCRGSGYAPSPNNYPVQSGAGPSPPSSPSSPPPSSPSGDQGVCGSGDAAGFPTRCYFNNDPQGRYVCCDTAGCNGFNPPDYKFPHCQVNGYVPPGYGVGASSTPSQPPSTPPSPPTSGSQGVCGTGDAAGFPTRCYFNSDPQGRYVCCDSAGCNGFNPPDFSFPHCSASGYVPPGYGVGASPTTPATAPTTVPPSGSQGVCGTGAAASFPVRCWYNNDPQGRYVCCDSAGCDGFNPPDFFFPHCAANGFVPPSI